MRLRYWIVAMTALLTATTMITAMADTINTTVPTYSPRTGGNYSGPRWYGYFYNNGLVPDNYGHTNITMVAAVERNDSNQQADATYTIEAGLTEAKQYGERAMVDVEGIVFDETGGANNTCYGLNPTAFQDFQTFAQKLIDDGFLIPNHPELSTVSSFYIADEPDRSCNGSLADTSYYVLITPPDGGQQVYIPQPEANPVLINAIYAIRQNSSTANFPLATIVTQTLYGDMSAGLGLFDWIGLDDYSSQVNAYLSDFTGFEASAQINDKVGGTPQYFFMVPLVSYGVNSIGVYTDVAPIQDRFNSDSNIVGIMPFKWSASTDANGMNATSSWAPDYIALGKLIVAADLPPSQSPPPSPPGSVSATEITVIEDYAILH